jgi:hypothetical protein
MAPEEPAENGRGSFFTTLPGILTGVAALITAVVSLIAVFGTGGDGDGGDGNGNRTELRAYQQRVIGICDQVRDQGSRFEQEAAQLNQQANTIGQQFQASGDPSVLQPYFDSAFDLIDRAVTKSAALKGELEALSPPEDLQATQDEAVALWQRDISTGRSARNQLSDARDTFFATGDPTALTEADRALSDPELASVEDQIDVQLRRLGGSGCDPAA